MSQKQYVGCLDELIKNTSGRTEVPLAVIMETLKSNLREINVSNTLRSHTK